MSHTLSFNHGLDVVVLRVTQVVDIVELQKALGEIVHLSGFKEGLCLVIDLRKCKTALSAADMRQLAEHAESADAKWGKTKWLILASSDLAYGLSRMFIALSEKHEVETKVFRNLVQADDWLGLGVELEEVLRRTPE